jgi:hypothetical protein
VHMDRDGNDLYIEIHRHLDPTILHRARRMLSEAVSVKMEGKQRCQKKS